MLEIVFNDNFTQLSLINNVNHEGLSVIDDDLYCYESISYNPFIPKDEDVIDIWSKALKKYLRIGHEDIYKGYKQNMYNKSLSAFKEWLSKQERY